MYHLVSLQGSQITEYESLTFQHMLSRFRHIDHDPRLIAIGAESAFGPIGLVVVDLHPEHRSAEVLSLYVKNDYRNKGIGAALLSKIEDYIHQAGCETVKLSYYSGKKITPVLESFLNKEGWSDPIVQTLIYKADVRTMVQAPWVRKFNFPHNMHAFLWSELSPIERESLRDSVGHGYPSYLSPFRNEQRIDPLISLGLNSGNQIVGWSIVHRVSKDTLLYNSLFIQPEYQQLGCAINLLAASIQLQEKHAIPYGMFAVNQDNQVMNRIVERWLKPYTIKMTKMYTTFKTIS